MRKFGWEVLRLALALLIVDLSCVALTGEYLDGTAAGWGNWL